MQAVKELHDFGIVHGDLSLENVVLSSDDPTEAKLKLIDFSMCSTKRSLERGIRGKPSYQAPEMQDSEERGFYDGNLSDAFAVGVILYYLFLRDHPWLSTTPGACKSCEF